MSKLIESTDPLSPIPKSEDPEQILSRVTHELKHPITVIKGYADLILRGEIGSREAAERIYDIAEKMEMLQKDIFDYLLDVRSNLDIKNKIWYPHPYERRDQSW